MLDVLSEAFGHDPRDERFQKRLPHCTPYPDRATESDYANHLICLVDGEIAGLLGAYPLDLAVKYGNAERIVRAFGIGQVCCLPKYRNRGVMTALMNAAHEKMLKKERTVGLLFGDRARYGHFGYDFAGGVIRFQINMKDLMESFDNIISPDLEMRHCGVADIDAMTKAYQTLPSRILRSEDRWKLHISRPTEKWYIGRIGDEYAYFAHKTGYVSRKPVSQAVIEEACGSPRVLFAMLCSHMEDIDAESVQIKYPATEKADTLSRMLYSHASQIDLHNKALFALIDADGLLHDLGVILSDGEDAETVARDIMRYSHDPERGNREELNFWFAGADNI